MPAEMTIDKRALLANVPLFGRLEPDELDRLVAYMRLVRHPPGRSCSARAIRVPI